MELKSVSDFVSSLDISALQHADGQFKCPHNRLTFECLCGETHHFEKNQYGYLTPPLKPGEPNEEFWGTSILVFVGDQQLLVRCRNLNGLVCVQVDKKLFKQSARAVYFVSYATINKADQGWGLCLTNRRGTFDFNVLGQARSDYPTPKIYRTITEFEDVLLAYGEENLDGQGSYVPELVGQVFKCSCGGSHDMGGLRSDYSMIQSLSPYEYETVPVVWIWKNRSANIAHGLVYRCPSAYVMLALRPSRLVIWSAEIPLFDKQNKDTSKLPEGVARSLEYLTSKIELEKNFRGQADT